MPPPHHRGAPMKRDGLLRHLVLALLIALVLYAVAFTGIEHRRTRLGPWQVMFTRDASGAAALRINQPRLAITNVWIVFLELEVPVTHGQRLAFYKRYMQISRLSARDKTLIRLIVKKCNKIARHTEKMYRKG